VYDQNALTLTHTTGRLGFSAISMRGGPDGKIEPARFICFLAGVSLALPSRPRPNRGIGTNHLCSHLLTTQKTM